MCQSSGSTRGSEGLLSHRVSIRGEAEVGDFINEMKTPLQHIGFTREDLCDEHDATQTVTL